MSKASYTAGARDLALLDTTIGRSLNKTVARFPVREALVDVPSGRLWTYAELGREVDSLALGLLADGIRPGDCVGIWAPNCAEWFLVQYATAKVGAILVNINPASRAHELEYVLNQSGIRLLFAVEAFKGSDNAAMIEEVGPRCERLEQAVFLRSSSWESLLAAGRAGDPAELAAVAAGLSPNDPINIQYTSGTTGSPKGATLSHRNILNNGYAVGELLGYTEEDRICVPVPFYHGFGMVMGNLAATSHGACVVIPASTFDPVLTLRAAADQQCTSLHGVPTMFIALLGVPDFASYDLSRMRTGVMAGSPCPVEVMKQVIPWMPEVSICYGMTETSPIFTQTRRDDSIDRRVSSVGRVHPNVEVKVVDPESGETVPRGTPGELRTRGYSVMLGYWDEPGKTAEAIDADRWMHTGDLAVMDDEGYLSIIGRIKDMVIRGGEKIYPLEIEEFLHTHPDVIEAQVIGVPDERYGEELMAWIRLRDGATALDAAAVKAFATAKLAQYKIPRYVHVVDAFPMTIAGKVRKVEMREQAADILGL
jgi:fatty-acyl-CoA synthase